MAFKLKDWWNKNVKPYGAETAALVAAGITLVVTGSPGSAIAVGGKIYSSLAEVEQAKIQGDIAEDQYNAAKNHFNQTVDYQKKLYNAQMAAYSAQGQYLRDQYKAETGAYADEGQFLEDVFQSEKGKAEALRAAYTQTGEITDTEQGIMDRQERILREGDPMAQQLYQDELSRATGAIRGQGTQAMQRTLGHVVGSGLEGSIVARELVRQTDRDTLKALSETARDLAIQNKREQMQYRREAQGRLDTMGLGIEDRKRQSLLSLAGITDPVKGYQGPAPVEGVQGPEPVQGIPGVAPVDTSGMYKPDYWKAGWNIAGGLAEFDDWDPFETVSVASDVPTGNIT